MNKNQIVHAHWRNKKTGEVIYVTQKSSVPQTFNYERTEGETVHKGWIGKTELKTNWERTE